MVIPFRVFLAVLVFGLVVAGGKFAFAAEDFAPATKSLFLAVKKNDLGAVKRSLLDGADVTVKTSGGLTAIDIAIDKGYFRIAHYLLAWRQHLRPILSRPRLVPAPSDAEEPPVSEVPPFAEAPPATTETSQPVSAEPLSPAPSGTISPLVASTYPQTPTQTTAPVPAQIPPSAFPQEPIVPSSYANPALPVTAPAAAMPPVSPVSPSGSPSQPEAAALAHPASSAETPPVAEKTVKTAKIVVPDEAKESSGILGRITDFFSFGSGKDEEPPSPLQASLPSVERETSLETATALPAEPEAEPETRPAAPEEEEARDRPGILDSIAGFFSSEPASREPPPAKPSEPAAASEQVPAPQALTELVKPPAPYKRAAALFEPAVPSEQPASPVPASGATGKGEAEPRETALLVTPSPPPSPPARAIELVVGKSMKLGNPRAVESSNICVRKKALDNWFCVESVDWPDDIGDAFQVHTTLYRGRKAIVRYEGGVVTQIHALFPKGNFWAIVRHFTERFGVPAEKTDNWAVLADEPNRRNRTVRWRDTTAEGAGDGILEVREIDDLRWSSQPDTRHGVVWLHREDADPIFRYVSWSDFLLARVGQTLQLQELIQ